MVGPQTPPTGPQTPPAGPQTPWMDSGWLDGWTEFLPFYRTLSPVGAAALLTSETSNQQGKGIADLMMPFGDWFFLSFFLSYALLRAIYL